MFEFVNVVGGSDSGIFDGDIGGGGGGDCVFGIQWRQRGFVE
jgi:hypothetical protein